jgi:hypothetical protein
MKKSLFIFAMAIVALAFSSCNLRDEDEVFESVQMRSAAVVEDTISYIDDDVWYWKKDTVEIRIALPSSVKVYANDTTVVTDSRLSTVSFAKVGGKKEGSYQPANVLSSNVKLDDASVKACSQTYKHTLDKVADTLVHTWAEGMFVLNGQAYFSPDRKSSLKDDAVSVTPAGSDSLYRYYIGRMDYTVSIDGQTSNVSGFKTLAITNDTPEDELVDIKKTGEGFEEKTYDSNGNLKTGRSWVELEYTYTISGTEKVVYDVILNYGVTSPARAIEYGANFDNINAIGSGASQVVNGPSYKVGAYVLVTPSVQDFNSGLTFSGNSYNRSFVANWETAVWSDGSYTFAMPSPVYQNMQIDWQNPVAMSSYNGYERMLQTINLNGSINGKALMGVKAETELRVKEEEEEFQLVVVDSGFVYENPTTSKTWIKIRKVGNKGTVSEYTREIFVYNGIEEPSLITKVVDDFDSNQKNMKTTADKLISTRVSGEFKVYLYKSTVKVGTENVDRQFAPYYEKAVWTPQSFNMPYKKYENITDEGYSTADMSDETSGSDTYTRKKYTYTISATYNAHPATATGEAVLKLLQQGGGGDDPRETPSWLGDPEWAEYTRVQRATGAQFEDMIVFGYQNGVVLAPNGNPDLNNGVFAYDQSVATVHGVQKCVSGSCYTAVFKNGSWIPAKCETQNSGKSNETWIYTGKGATHSVMANNATTLGIGCRRTWNPNQTVTINNGTITVKYSRNNAVLNGNDLVSLK